MDYKNEGVAFSEQSRNILEEEKPIYFKECDSRVKLLGHFVGALTGTFGLAAFDSHYDDFVSRWRELSNKG